MSVLCSFYFQMPGLLSLNQVLPNFPNVWPYNTQNFANAGLEVQLMMANKLVVKAQKSEFAVISIGPRQGEELCHWQVRVANVCKKIEQHETAHCLLQERMYGHADHMNGKT